MTLREQTQRREDSLLSPFGLAAPPSPVDGHGRRRSAISALPSNETSTGSSIPRHSAV